MFAKAAGSPVAVDSEIIFCNEKIGTCFIKEKSDIPGKAFPVPGIQGTGGKRGFSTILSDDPGISRGGTGFQSQRVPPAETDFRSQKRLDLLKNPGAFFKVFPGRIRDTAPTFSRQSKHKSAESVMGVLKHDIVCNAADIRIKVLHINRDQYVDFIVFFHLVRFSLH